MTRGTIIAAVGAAVLMAATVPAKAETAPGDPVEQQALVQAADDKVAAELAVRLQAAQSEVTAAIDMWETVTQADLDARRAAQAAQQDTDAATRTAGTIAGQAYRGGMISDFAPLLAIVDAESTQQALRAATTAELVAARAGQRVLTTRRHSKVAKQRARVIHRRVAAAEARLNDARARLAAVQAAVAGRELRAGSTVTLEPEVAQRNLDAARAWWDLQDAAQRAGAPTFTADQLRSGRLPRGVVKVKHVPGVARFRAGKKSVPVVPNETVNALAFQIGALGVGYAWQADPGTDCVRLTGTAWGSQGADLAELATHLPLRTTTRVHPGDQVFLANGVHGLYQTGIAVSGSQMTAADADSAAVTVVPFKQSDVWRVARPGAQGTTVSEIPQGSDPWRCGADPLRQLGLLSGTPRQIIEQSVLPYAMAHGFPHVTPASVLAANMRHGPTVNGGRSDHEGPGDFAWAADISNGGSPTPEMDGLAQALATAYGMPWTGSGVTQIERDGYRVQLLYRTTEGGNHFNHVHIGIQRSGPTQAPTPQF